MSRSVFAPLELYSRSGERLYLNRPEQERLKQVVLTSPSTQRVFVDTLLFSGARITEALELRYSMVDIDAGTLTFRTLKQGGLRVYKNRSVPDHVHHLNLPELTEVLELDPQNENLEVILRQSVKQPILDKWRDVPVPGRYLERLDAVLEVRRCQIKCKSHNEKQDQSLSCLQLVGPRLPIGLNHL